MTIEVKIKEKLVQAFKPDFLEVLNHSKIHVNHTESPKTEASHLYIKMKSNIFKDKSRIESHRLVYSVLAEELKENIHALQLDLQSI